MEGLILTLVYKLNHIIGKICKNLYKNVNGIFAVNILTVHTEEQFMEHIFLESEQLKKFYNRLNINLKAVVNNNTDLTNLLFVLI